MNGIPKSSTSGVGAVGLEREQAPNAIKVENTNQSVNRRRIDPSCGQACPPVHAGSQEAPHSIAAPWTPGPRDPDEDSEP